MYSENFSRFRKLRTISINTDIVVVGGGLTGVCCAITAARQGTKVCLIEGRPMLGGNASSEVRLWALGATSHMGNNNRWSREGGVIDEIMTENVYRNKEGNPVLFDMVLIDKVLAEKNITLLLNTVVYEVKKESDRIISSVTGYNAGNETKYVISGRLFADCSGDGILGYMSGAAFRIGSEDKETYGEGFAPDKEKYGELLGHTILFYMKDAGKSIKYVAPDFALKDAEKHISKIHNNEYFNTHNHGCKYWWIEYGGRLDTVHDTETIKYELWKVVYGIWDYIKNSRKFPDMDTYTLEWVGMIPGKRESRRFKGLYTLTQQDIMEQMTHDDAVSYGGWAIDLHPSDGVYADGKACNQWHSKGVYQIPYRCFLGNDIDNLMFGGRIASSSHVANGSTRVMCTSAHGGQSIGMALALCIKGHHLPAYFVDKKNIKELQTALIGVGQYIPGVIIKDLSNKVNKAEIRVSSRLGFNGYKPNGTFRKLKSSTAPLFPVVGKMPTIGMLVEAECETTLEVQLRTSQRKNDYTPDCIIGSQILKLKKGLQEISIQFKASFDECQYVFVCFMANENVSLPESDELLTGTTTVMNQKNEAVSNYGRQDPPENIGVDSFEFWCPQRRPDFKNVAFHLDRSLDIYNEENIRNNIVRPVGGTNAWTAAFDDKTPYVDLLWNEEQSISEITLFFDTDTDNAMETIQMGHMVKFRLPLRTCRR